MRCWGRSTAADAKGLQFERSDCQMESGIFVTGRLTTGTLTVRHEAYDGRKLGVLRFAATAIPTASRTRPSAAAAKTSRHHNVTSVTSIVTACRCGPCCA